MEEIASPTVGSSHDLLTALQERFPDAIPFHPLANLFPFPSEEDFRKLVEDVRNHGLLSKIWLVEGKVFDGRCRYLACLAAGVEPEFDHWIGSRDLICDVVSLNLIRRHLNESQRGMVGAKLVSLRQQQKSAASENVTQSGANLRRNKKTVTKQVAKEMKVSPRTIQHAEKILASDRPELVALVEAGELAVSKASKELLDPKLVENIDPVRENQPELCMNNSGTTAGDTSQPQLLGSQGSIAAPPAPALSPAHQLLLSWSGMNELLKKVTGLLKGSPKPFDPETQVTVLFGDPGYAWSPEDNDEEIRKTETYVAAIEEAAKELSSYAYQLRKKKGYLMEYLEELRGGMTPPLLLNVTKTQLRAFVENDEPSEPVRVAEVDQSE